MGERPCSWELGRYALALVLVAGAPAFWPVLRALSPRAAVELRRRDPACERFLLELGPRPWEDEETGPPIRRTSGPEAPDPWGRPWRWNGYLYSTGPDPGQSADDLSAWTCMPIPFELFAPGLVLRRPCTALVTGGCVLLVWTWVWRRVARAPRSSRFLHEALRAAWFEAPLLLGGALWAAGAWRAWREWGPDVPWLLLPAPLACSLAWAACVYSAALAWRLSRPAAAQIDSSSAS